MSKPKKRQGSPYYWYDFTVGGQRFRGSCETDDYETAKTVTARLRDQAVLNRHLKRKPRITLDQAFAKYWKDRAQYTRSSDTAKSHLREMLSFFDKETYLDDLDDADINRYIGHLRAGKKHTLKSGRLLRREITPGTVNRKLDVLRAVVLQARKLWGVEAPDVDIGRHRLQTPAPRTRWITPDQANQLLAAAAPHLKGPIRCALLTGLRLGNIVGLTWEQVDLEERVIRLRVKSALPGRKLHEIPITDQLHALLMEQRDHTVAVNNMIQPTDHVFLRTFKNTLSRGKKVKKPRRPQPVIQFRRSFRNACLRAGITDFRFHDLRHTAATWMRQQGIAVEDIKEVLGHSDIRMTLKYAHHDSTTKTRALDALAARRKEAVL